MAGLVYKPLESAQNQIRVLRMVYDEGEPPNVESLRHFEFPKLSLHNVSLGDFTNLSRIFMALARKDQITSKEHIKFMRNFLWTMPTGSEDSHSSVSQDIPTTARRQPDGRWNWGDFRAISYVWGKSKASKKVMIDGHMVCVTDNLFGILECLWLGHGPAIKLAHPAIWVDALCINQQDVEERNLEVRRMGDIYHQTFQTMGWVGNGTRNIQQAAAFLKLIAKERLDSHRKHPSGERFPLSTRQRVLEDVQDQALLGIARFILSDYWTRLWIMQEVFIARDNIIFVGRGYEVSVNDLYLFTHEFMAPNTLEMLMKLFSRLRAKNNQVDEEHFFNSFYLIQLMVLEHARNAGVFDILRQVSILKQSDKRDKIYAILSLIPPALANKIVPNYQHSVISVYFNFTQAVIDYTKSLDIISHGRTDIEHDPGLPTWVPDWSSDWATAVNLWTSSYRADGNKWAQVTFMQGMKLSGRGFVFDVCDSIAGNLSDSATEVVDIDDSHDLKFVRRSYSESPNAYETTEGTREALWRTMVANATVGGKKAPQAFEILLHIPSTARHLDYVREYEKLRWMNCGLSIGGVSLKEFFTISEETLECSFDEETITKASITASGLGHTHRLTITEAGYLGLIPSKARKGDKICILLGCSVPLVVRPIEDTQHWELIGSCYVHGIMEGEAMEWLKDGRRTLRDFVIC